MDKEKYSTKVGKRKRTYLLWVFLAVVVTATFFVLSFLKLRQDLYEERAYNSGRVTNKIAVNIQTVMESKVEHVDFDAKIVADRKYTDDNDVASYLKKLEEMGSTKYGDDILLLIDSKGDCLSSEGTTFRWTESGILNTNEPEIVVSSINALGSSDEKMLFIVPLPQKVETMDRTFTHLCLVMDQSVIKGHLAKAHYVDKSAIFIIDGNGTYLYKQAEGSAFADVFNLIAKLEKWEYLYQTSKEETLYNIQNQISGCACVAVEGTSYFVIYESLNVNDWTAVYIVPENGASSNSSNFMRSIIWTVMLLAAIVMANVIGIILFNHFQSMKQQTLVNEQLQRAAEAERSANNAKTRFLSSMSHDIRTPMNAIVGMTAIAEKHIDDTNYVVDCLTKIHLASDHLLTLINDILDVSKIESGKMTLNPVVFSLAESVSNMFNIVSPQAKAKKQTFDFYIEKIEHEYLMGDELRLNQIFINILTNAIKYTPEFGKITATIREEMCEGQDHTVRLTYTVQDTGIGMTEDFMENMYGSFSRATDTRVNKIQGTGLGLAICKQLVDLMNGTIVCESAPGKGTKFTITLTFPAAQHPERDYKLPDLRMLLVDDDEMFLESASELFREMGVEIETAESGREAISMVAARHRGGENYSVIMMDWKMSDIDGIEAIRQIHTSFGTEIPIILISAYDSTDIEQVALDAGAVGFIRKPFFKALLYQKMNQYLNSSQDSSAENAEVDLAGMRVLVAEDNDLNWEIAQELLNMSEIYVERAENGQLCVERLLEASDGEFDLVLMDVQMPILNGKEATRKIREMDRKYLRDIPIIAMTADAFAEDVSACMEAGMNGHISKPIDLERLFFELRKVKQKKES